MYAPGFLALLGCIDMYIMKKLTNGIVRDVHV
jgi:hypothetical protein